MNDPSVSVSVWSLVPLGVPPDIVCVTVTLNELVMENVTVSVRVCCAVCVVVFDTSFVTDGDTDCEGVVEELSLLVNSAVLVAEVDGLTLLVLVWVSDALRENDADEV